MPATGNLFDLPHQIKISHSIGAIYAKTANQRSLIQESALLSRKLVVTSDEEEQSRARSHLNETILSLEKTHQDLLNDRSGKHGLPQEVRAIYFDSPWLLDSQMQKYISELHALAEAPGSELSRSNPHFLEIYDAAMSGPMVDALNEVVSAYQKRDEEKTDFLQWWAIWDIGSTVVVLVLSGFLIFRPMARRVRQDIELLWQFNENLEQLVAERSALAERRASEAAISEALYRSLVDNFPLQVNRKDLEGRFTFVNDSFCRFLGKAREEIIGKTNFDFLPAELAEKFQRYERRVMETGEIIQTLEEQARFTDGNPRYLEVLKTPMRNANGEIVEVQTVFLDVTERVEAERRSQ